MDRELVVLVTLVVYKVVLILIGIVTSRINKDESDYFLGGRRLGPLVSAISASASSSSGWTLLGVSGAAYAYGVSALWIFPGCVGGFMLNWCLLARRLRAVSRETGALTVTEILAGPPGGRYHRALNVLASLIILFCLSFYVASQYQSAGKAFTETFELPTTPSILIGAGIIVIYTMLGGFWAVSITDTLQGLLMALSAVLLPVTALVAVGGPVALAEKLGGINATEAGYTSFTRGLPLMTALGFILGYLGIGLGYPGQPHVVNRFMALRDDTAVRQARVIAILWAVIVYAGMLTLGLCGRVLTDISSAVGDPEVVFVAATHALFPPVLSGILVAAVLSALMSTADSQLLVAASSVTHDLGLGRGTGGHLVARSRVVVLVISLVSVGLALVGSQDIFTRVLFAWSAMGAAFGPLLLVSIYRPVSGFASLMAMITGFTMSVFFYSFDATRNTVFERVVPFVAALTIAVLGVWYRGRRSPGNGARLPEV